MSQIKVKDTRMHKTSERYTIPTVNGKESITEGYEIPVAEGKLVLIEVNHEKEQASFQAKNYLYYKPIIISETEKKEDGDWIYDSIGNFMFECKYATGVKGQFKILALPEHFSPKHLQAIVAGKMKEGSTILIECEVYGQLEKLPPIDLHQIKLNSSNHITLHKVEEKMYTREEVQDLTRKAYGQGYTDHNLRGKPDYTKWFEQNVE